MRQKVAKEQRLKGRVSGAEFNAEVYANRTTPTGEQAQTALSALRKVITSAPLIPGLKSLLARQYNDPRWTNIRPPHPQLSPSAETQLFSDYDKALSPS